MKVKKTILLELNDDDIEVLQVILDISDFSKFIRNYKEMDKGYSPHEIKKAFELFEYLQDL